MLIVAETQKFRFHTENTEITEVRMFHLRATIRKETRAERSEILWFLCCLREAKNDLYEGEVNFCVFCVNLKGLLAKLGK